MPCRLATPHREFKHGSENPGFSLFDAPVATPETNTRSVGTPLSDPNEIRVIRISADGKRHTRIYTGSRPADLDERCQAHADLSGCWVQWHNAAGLQGVSSYSTRLPIRRR